MTANIAEGLHERRSVLDLKAFGLRSQMIPQNAELFFSDKCWTVLTLSWNCVSTVQLFFSDKCWTVLTQFHDSVNVQYLQAALLRLSERISIFSQQSYRLGHLQNDFDRFIYQMWKRLEEAAHVFNDSTEAFLDAKIQRVLQHSQIVSIMRKHFFKHLLHEFISKLTFH